MRPIDADELKKAIDDYAEKRQDTLLWQADIEELIDNAPTVEPETKIVANVTFDKEQLKELVEKAKNDILAQIERPQGEWIEHTERITFDTYYECSNCKEPWTTIEGTPWQNMMNFCPNCGASMKPKTCTNCETFGGGCGDCEVGDDD